MGDWQESLLSVHLATCFQNVSAVAALLDPEKYIQTWPCVPEAEVRASAVTVHFDGHLPRKLLLHKRRVSVDAAAGKANVFMCRMCHSNLTKKQPELPSLALACGKWLGRHPEIMRSMPFGHRLLLPVRRVLMTKVFFAPDGKNLWQRSHSIKGIHGLTTLVEQASAAPAIFRYPPSELGASFEAVFVGVNPDDKRKAQCFPINKQLFLRQHEFLRKYSAANKVAEFDEAAVAEWEDGMTPPVLRDCLLDAPVDNVEDSLQEEGEEEEEFENQPDEKTPLDSTEAETASFSFLCSDTAELDVEASWNIAARKLESLRSQAEAIRKEEELAELVLDRTMRVSLLQTAQEFKATIGSLSKDSYLRSIENALTAEHKDSDRPAAHFAAGAQPQLIVPTSRKYANMWSPEFWQEFNPFCWTYGDFVYNDPKLNQRPYKQATFKEFVKCCLRREELEYDMYDGEHYQAELYGEGHWDHQVNVSSLLQAVQEAEDQHTRTYDENPEAKFGVNRFRKDPYALFVLSSFWRLMSGFTAINIGLRIPGLQNQLKELARLPDQLALISAEDGDNDGVHGLINRAAHLFNLITGKVCGSTAYRVRCRHEFSAYTIHFGSPVIFCTPNIADNRNFLILLTQNQSVNLDLDADPGITLSYEQLRLRVMHDPVGQAIVVELLLRLFVLHLVGVLPDAVAQPDGSVEHKDWLNDGVPASFTSLGCMCIVQAARGELETSGRGSLHGHFELWAVSMSVQEAFERYSDLPAAERVEKLREVVSSWLNFFQRSHHSLVRHLPFVHAGEVPLPDPLPMTQSMMQRCRMDGGQGTPRRRKYSFCFGL